MNKRIFDITGLRVTGGIKANGFFSKALLGIGGDKIKDMFRSPDKEGIPGLSAEGKKIEGQLHGYADMLGRGRFFDFQGLERGGAFAELGEQKIAGLADAEIAMSRLQTDEKISGFAQRSMEQQYGQQEDELTEFFDTQEYQAKQAELPFRSDMWAGATRSAGQLMGAYNQQISQNAAIESQMGTMGSNIAGGIGEGAGYMASLEYAKRFGG